MKDCPQCDGYGFDGFEEDTGRPFTCYFCGETGKVSDATWTEWDRAMTDGREYQRLHPPSEMRGDFDGEWEHKFSFLPREILPKPAKPVWVPADYDDIPL